MEKLKQVLNSPLGKRKSAAPSQRNVFGASLDELVNIRDDSSNGVPFLVDKLCKYICFQGIGHEGIFRVNGSTRIVEKLKDSFERHGDADLDASDDVMAVAGLLKLFLRELQESVIPENLTSKFVHVQESYRKDKMQCLEELRILVESLPIVHYDLLKYLMRFLVDVAGNTANKMTPMGLAIVFGPNLFRCSAGIEGLKDQGVTNEIVCKFIQDYEQLFGDLEETTFHIQSYNPQRKKKIKDYRKRNPPARPPPPKISDIPPLNLASLPECTEDCRPSPSPRLEEYMERASPFTIADTDGHSSMASPILSAVASELVTKTISEAVLEHIFNVGEMESRSIFDNWGVDSDAGSHRGTPIMSRLGTPQTGHDYIPNGIEDPGLHPRPRPLSAINTGSGDYIHPQPQPRPSLASTNDDHDSATSVRPTPKPRTKSAPGRNRARQLASTNQLSLPTVDVPIVNGHVTEQPANGLPVEIQDDFEVLKPSDVPALTHFKKNKGPARKAPRRHKILTEDIVTHSNPEELTVQEVNNNEEKSGDTLEDLDIDHTNHNQSTDISSRTEEISADDLAADRSTEIPKLDLRKLSPQGDKSPTKHSDEETTPRQTQSSAADTLQPTEVKQMSQEEEKRAAEIKHLSKKINSYKKKIKQFEEQFEAEHGHKPSTQDKNNKLSVKKALVELSKVRKELKSAEEEMDDLKESAVDDPHAGEQSGSRPTSEMVPSSEPPSMAETLEHLLAMLREKRKDANRPEDLNLMTKDVLQEEKQAVQRALLHFESKHGRPQNQSEKELMKPLYDRYRQIKKALVNAPTTLPPNDQANKSSEQPADDADVNADILVTQNPDMLNQAVVHGNEDEERTDSPGDKAGKESNLHDLPIHELKAELERVNAEKKKMRKILREFEDEFQKEYGRKVQKEDRGPMANEYQEYKQIKAKIKLLEVLLSKQDVG